MRRLWGFSAAIAGLALVTGAAHAAPANTAFNIMQATADVQAGKCAEALPLLAQLWDDTALQASDPDLAADFRAKRVLCTAQVSGNAAALVLSTENIGRAPVSVDAYGLHIFLQLGAGKPEEAAQSLDLALDKLGPKAVDLNDLAVAGTLVILHETDPARERALITHVEDARWQIHDITGRPLIDLFRLEALRDAVKAGDQAHAGAFRADIDRDAAVYMLSQGDGTLSRADVPPKDVRVIAAGEIKDVEAYINKNPRDLSAINYLITLEAADGQDDLALTQVNSMIGLIDANSLSAFENTDSYGDLLSQRAILLAELGQTEKADAAFVEGEARLANRGPFSFYASELQYLVARGREADALALAKRFDPTGLRPDQLETVDTLVACADAYTGNTAAYQAWLASVPGAAPTRTRPLLCAGDTNGAARNIIAMINIPEARDDMISFMQNRPSAVAFGARNQIYIDALAALRKRGDVLAAAGGANIIVRDWPLKF